MTRRSEIEKEWSGKILGLLTIYSALSSGEMETLLGVDTPQKRSNFYTGFKLLEGTDPDEEPRAGVDPRITLAYHKRNHKFVYYSTAREEELVTAGLLSDERELPLNGFISEGMDRSDTRRKHFEEELQTNPAAALNAWKRLRSG